MSSETKASTAEPFYQQFAWVILFAVGILVMVPGVLHFTGYNTDPATAEEIVGMSLSELEASNSPLFDLYAFYFRFGGLSDVGFGLLVAILAATAFREGRTWAWYTLWSVPVFFAAAIVLLYLYGLSILAPVGFVILTILGLLLPIRKFFPTDQDSDDRKVGSGP